MPAYESPIRNRYPDARAMFGAFLGIRERLAQDNSIPPVPMGIGDFVYSWLHFRRQEDLPAPLRSAVDESAADFCDLARMQYCTGMLHNARQILAATRGLADTETRIAAAIVTGICRNAVIWLRHNGADEDLIQSYFDNDDVLRLISRLEDMQPDFLSNMMPPEEMAAGLARAIMRLPVGQDSIAERLEREMRPLLDIIGASRNAIIDRPVPPALRDFLHPPGPPVASILKFDPR